MSNIQAQIDALAVSIQVLDNTLSNVTGNTLSNYNQLSRIVAQQGNIYNTIYFGLGNLTTGNLKINSNSSINGYLAINSTTANANLDVLGNASISGNVNMDNGTFWLDDINNRIGINTTNPLQALDVKGSANISVDTFIRNNLAIGSTVASANLDVVGNARISSNLLVNGGTMWVDAVNNRVGINNTNPQQALDISGNANVSQNFLTGGNANISGNVGIIGNIYGTANLILLNGNLGIRTLNPQYALDVAGNANISQNILIGDNANVFGNLGVSGNIIGTSNLIILNGNVGIRNLNPAYTVDVAGNANISQNILIGGNSNISGNVGIIGNIYSTANLILLNGNLGIRTLNPQFALDVAGNANISQNFLIGGNANISGNVDIIGNIFGSANLILLNGNLGIRTLNPQFALDVAGNANISQNILIGDNANVFGNLGVSGNIIGTSNLIILNGNVGIRNLNPAYTVDVVGNINFTGNLYQNGNIFTSGGGGSSQWTTSGSNIYYNVVNGNVGIGTTTPYYTLDVGGSANVGSNVYCMNMFVINDCLVQGGDFSIMNGNLTVYKRFNSFGDSVLNGNLTVYNADFYNYGNSYVYNGLYLNKNGALYTNGDSAGQHAFYAFDTVNLMSTLYGGADDTNRVGYFQARGYGGGLPLLLNPNGGNVGVGTGVPRATLSVSGNAVITGNVNIDNGLIWTDPVNNRVGINNTNPQYDLDVKGGANISGNVICNNVLMNSLQFLSGSNITSPFKMVYGRFSTGATGSANNYNVPVTFPNSFSSSPFIILVVPDNPAFTAASLNYTTTGFTGQGRNAAGSTQSGNITYLAIGSA